MSQNGGFGNYQKTTFFRAILNSGVIGDQAILNSGAMGDQAILNSGVTGDHPDTPKNTKHTETDTHTYTRPTLNRYPAPRCGGFKNTCPIG